MIDHARHWLQTQSSLARELWLIVDRLAEPDPIQQLFGADLMQDYVSLFQDSAVADMAELGPWLVRLPDGHAPLLQAWLAEPERAWGWLASAEPLDLQVLANHWRSRMLVDDNGQRSLYRFQDNRVITRHLLALSAEQRALLLGPLSSTLSWDGGAWQTIDNPSPGLYSVPTPAPWLHLPEPEQVTAAIQRHNLELWLWQNHTSALCQALETQPFDSWLDERLAQGNGWGWRSSESLQFLLEQHLNPALADHSAWLPQPGETAEIHLARCRHAFATSIARSEQA
ncbi:DUF4123 domain-containing protein [Pseudomonas sp. LS44]|uniref:DUF4123 domain-containing protein n=1 Tax=Pseudomonas sp. LS44 TaxID=1357074 RepID=UPI00215A4D61|nr:DUF4123 domain-containing protein [Pseudomonas sp. LS44]UVE17754.1 DUF4123 domain-containing protein [Pseudomonas sp. LS44]